MNNNSDNILNESNNPLTDNPLTNNSLTNNSVNGNPLTNNGNNSINGNNSVNANNSILNDIMSPEELKELDIRNENRYRTYIATEAALASWLRNTLNLFVGGIAIITFSKSKEKYLLSLIFSLGGLLMGIIAYIEFNERKKLIEKRQFGNLKIASSNQQATLWVLIIITGLYVLRFFVVSKKYTLKDIFKSK